MPPMPAPKTPAASNTSVELETPAMSAVPIAIPMPDRARPARTPKRRSPRPNKSADAPDTAEKTITPDTAAAVAQIGARTGDPARDIHEPVRADAIARLLAAGVADNLLRPLREIVPQDSVDASRAFGEALPEGLVVSMAEK